MNRQLYPDLLRAAALTRIVLFHFMGWKVLTYFPSLGIMFALGGWFMAVSLNAKSTGTVLIQRLARLLPTWWTFAVLCAAAGLFYTQGAGTELKMNFAWLLPLEKATMNLDNDYANGVTTVTWYIAAYLWFMLASPLLLILYKKLSWLLIAVPLIGLIVYSQLEQTLQETGLGETVFNCLIFGSCWLLGFAKADGTLHKLPKSIVYLVAVLCSGFGIMMTYQAGSLASHPVAQAVMSFGVALLLLSFNPDLSFLPKFAKSTISTMNAGAVTIYLSHNALAEAAYMICGQVLYGYELGQRIGLPEYGGQIGKSISFLVLAVLIFIAIKTIGLIEQRKFLN